jgi:hypothetical protein
MDVLNTRQNKVLDKKIDLNTRQNDQEVKHKNLTKYIELERVQKQCAKNMNQDPRDALSRLKIALALTSIYTNTKKVSYIFYNSKLTY